MENNNFKNEFNENNEQEETFAQNAGETADERYNTSDYDAEQTANETEINTAEVTEEIRDENTQSEFEHYITDDIFRQEDIFAKAEEKKRKKKAAKRAVSVVAIALAAGIVFGGASALTNKFVASRFKFNTTETIMSKSSGKVTSDSDIATIAASCMPSIVTITNMSVANVVTLFGTYAQESQSSGSGIVIGKNDTVLLIVTNLHVIAISKELKVIFSHNEQESNAESADGKKETSFSAQVKGYNIDKDLAVISIKLSDIPEEEMSKISIATVGDSSQMRPGDGVVAIGNALGYGQSVTTGIISAVDRELATEGENAQPVKNKFIQTDAAINPGNSGGALLNMRGELIGINSVKIAASGVEGMGYAIPITDVEEIIGELMIQQTRELVEDEAVRGYLGISGRDVSSSVSQMYGIPAGVYVESVEEGLSADKAGIKPGYIITKFDNTTVSTIAQLQDKLKYYKSGEKTTITVKIMGEGEYVEKVLDITLSSRKNSKAD